MLIAVYAAGLTGDDAGGGGGVAAAGERALAAQVGALSAARSCVAAVPLAQLAVCSDCRGVPRKTSPTNTFARSGTSPRTWFLSCSRWRRRAGWWWQQATGQAV